VVEKMIRIMALQRDNTLITSLSLAELHEQQLTLQWYWVDFATPTLEETAELANFGFHALAVEDCLRFLQKPKLDQYKDCHFFVLHALNPTLLKPEEVDIFVAEECIVTFHYQARAEIDELWERLQQDADLQQRGPRYIHYKLLDKLVDFYFPIVQKIEDRLAHLEGHITPSVGRTKQLLQDIYQVRSDLLSLRHTILPMQDLLYRMLNAEWLGYSREQRLYFSDIHDHLLKLSAMVDSSRAIMSELQDHYLSMNAYRMNTVMMTLTVMTTIFMPLTFIAGIYGMNFEYMPELHSPYGYFAVLGFMLFLGLSMFIWFKHKGWFGEGRR
jgi:magnesium transporter